MKATELEQIENVVVAMDTPCLIPFMGQTYRVYTVASMGVWDGECMGWYYLAFTHEYEEWMKTHPFSHHSMEQMGNAVLMVIPGWTKSSDESYLYNRYTIFRDHLRAQIASSWCLKPESEWPKIPDGPE